MKEPRNPVTLYLVRSATKQQVAILCTEKHLSKWVDKILEKGEEPEVKSISEDQLIQLLSPDPHLN